MTNEKRQETLNKLMSYALSNGISLPEQTSLEKPIFKNLKVLEDIDSYLFAQWQKYDLVAIAVAGGLGTLSSIVLRKTLANLHDGNWSRSGALDGGHSRENIDWVPGHKQPGGWGHRWLFGHDLFNPFEVNWEQYVEIARQSGCVIPTWLKASFYWMRHLLQDSFSREGLPLPGHSLLRSFLDPVKNREFLQVFSTIKQRDIVGAGVTNAIMGAYLWKTNDDLKQAIVNPNYRDTILMLGANCIALFSGLLMPKPSFNWSIIPVIGCYSYRLIKLEKEKGKLFAERDAALVENNATLDYNEATLEKYEQDLESFYKDTMAKHEVLKTLFLPNKEEEVA